MLYKILESKCLQRGLATAKLVKLLRCSTVVYGQLMFTAGLAVKAVLAAQAGEDHH